MVGIVKGGGRAHPTPHQRGLIFFHHDGKYTRSCRCHSVYSVVNSTAAYSTRYPISMLSLRFGVRNIEPIDLQSLVLRPSMQIVFTQLANYVYSHHLGRKATMYRQPRNRIHELTILLRFLGIILRVRRIWMNFLNHREGGVVFYQLFLLSPFQCTVTVRNRKNLCEFEEI